MSTQPGDARPDPVRHGLCATCLHVRVIHSARGSMFLLCRLHESDARYSKYPPLPVLRCAGHEPTGEHA